MATLREAFLRALLLSQATSHVLAACYSPSGDVMPNDSPCRDDTENSPCCGQGFACLSNGVCQGTGEELNDVSGHGRGSCTDREWRSSSCPNFCIDPEVDNINGGEAMGKCEGTSQDLYWCINRVEDQVDCEAGEGLVYFPGAPSILTTIGVAATTSTSLFPTTSLLATDTVTSSTPSASTRPSDASSSFDTAEQNDKDNSGGSASTQAATIGGAVGGSAAVVVVGVIAGWWFLRTRKRQTAAKADDFGYISGQMAYYGYSPSHSQGVMHEAPPNPWISKSPPPPAKAAHELFTISSPQELPTRFNDGR